MHTAKPAMLRAILRAPWQLRRNEGGLWGLALVAGMLLLPVALIVAVAPAGKLWAGLAIWLAICLQFAWLNQFANYLRQNQPLAARLVPGHLYSLRVVTLGNWLLFSTATAALLGATQGEPLAWGVAAALGMLATAVMMRWPWLWLAVWLLPLLANLLDQAGLWSSPWRAAWALWQRQPAALALLLGLASAYLLAQLLQDGGAAHARAYAKADVRRQALRDAMRGDRLALRQQGRLGLWLVWLLEIPFRWWMARLLRRADPRPAAVLARAELCLGAGTHWITQLASAALVLLLAALPSYVGSRYYGWELREALAGGAVIGIGIGLLSMAVNPLLALRAALYRSRREQALLMLVPGMPRGVRLNRLLAGRQLRQYLCAWLAASVAMLGLCAALQLEPYVIGYAIAALPFSLLLLRDASRLRQPGANLVVGTVIIMLALGGLAAALLVWTPIGPWTLLALVALPTALALRWRWQALARYPQAWPVGRASA